MTGNSKPYDFPVEVSAPITGNYWAEGPAALQVGEYVYVYFDKYTQRKSGRCVLVTWWNGRTCQTVSLSRKAFAMVQHSELMQR
ncbi:MAG: hypothetical protein J6J71_01485 [Prevotella sp.]|nr:hypothetical protein [Prevotella sp.]